MNSMSITAKRTISGQALIENVLIIPVIVIIIVMIFWYARLLLTRQQLIMAARYGTDLIAYSKMDEEQVRNEVRNYLCSEQGRVRRLDPDKFKDDSIGIGINRYNRVSVINAYKPLTYSPSYVEVYYEFDAPKLFSAWNEYFGSNEIAAKLRVAARSEVLAGTGCKGDDNN